MSAECLKNSEDGNRLLVKLGSEMRRQAFTFVVLYWQNPYSKPTKLEEMAEKPKH